MTTLVELLPVAISGLIGVIAGFYFARKEHARNVMLRSLEEAHREAEERQQYLPFVPAR